MPKSKRSRRNFMRLLLLCSASVIVLFMSALYCGSTMAQSLDKAQLTGQWQGEWRPYETKYQQSPGRLPMRLSINEKLNISGSVGESHFVSDHIEHQSTQILVRATLSPPLAFGKDHAKDHLIILITKIGHDQLSADVHFKSSYGFDFSMHPGELKASKLP